MKLPTPKTEAEKQRLELFKTWLKKYATLQNDILKKEGHKKLTYIPNAAWLLNDYYWKVIEQYIRPLLVENSTKRKKAIIHPYKIISVSEITVMFVLPVEEDDESMQRQSNAYFAWFIALQILEGWDHDTGMKISTNDIVDTAMHQELIAKNDVYPESFAKEHIKWLSYLNPEIEKPFVLNAQCWRLFFLLCHANKQNKKRP